MSSIVTSPLKKRTGIWCKKIDNTLRAVRPKHREPPPADIIRLVVDVLIHDDKSLAYSLGLVSKSFRSWVLKSLYAVVAFTSPAHVFQVLAVSRIAGAPAHHVRRISLVGLEMHIYGALERDGGLYKALEGFLADCDALEYLLYDFKRVPLPFVRPAPRSFKNVHWSHPSHDGWRGYEAGAMQHITHLRVDCSQNDRRNANTFMEMISSCQKMTHFCFGVDARTQATRVTTSFVRNLLQYPQMERVIVMVWHHSDRNPATRVLFDELGALKNPRICVLLRLYSGTSSQESSIKEWEGVAHGGTDMWRQAEIAIGQRGYREHIDGEDLGYNLVI